MKIRGPRPNRWLAALNCIPLFVEADGLVIHRRTVRRFHASPIGGRPLRRPRQCDRAEHRRDRADRTFQATARYLQSLCGAHRVQPLEQRGRSRYRNRLSSVGRSELCERQHPVGRRRLDRSTARRSAWPSWRA